MDVSINQNMYAPMAVNSSMTTQQGAYPPQSPQQNQVQLMEVKSANTFESFSGENASSDYMKGNNNFKGTRETSCWNLCTCSHQTLYYKTNTFGTITVHRYDPGCFTGLLTPIFRCFCRFTIPPYAETQNGGQLRILISKDLRGTLSVNNVIIGEYNIKFSGTCFEYLFGRTPMIEIRKSGSTDKFEYRTSPDCFRQMLEKACGCLVLSRTIQTKKNNNDLPISMQGKRNCKQGCCSMVYPSVESTFNSSLTDQDKLLFIGAWIFMQEVDNDTCHCCF